MTQCITKKKKKHRQSVQNRRRRHEQIPIGFETSVSIFEKFFFLIENGLPSLNLAWHCDPKRNPAPFFLLFLGCLENTFMQHAKKCGGNPPKAFANPRKKVKKVVTATHVCYITSLACDLPPQRGFTIYSIETRTKRAGFHPWPQRDTGFQLK